VLQVVHLALQAVLSALLQVASPVVAQVQVHQLVAALLQEDK
jgi:hypothetical protein